MPKLVKKDVVEHESSYRQHWPSEPMTCSEFLGGLSLHKGTSQSDARRQSADSNLPTSSVDIAEPAGTTAPIIEVNGAEAAPECVWQTAQQNSYVLFIDVMDSISPRRGDREFHVHRHR